MTLIHNKTGKRYHLCSPQQTVARWNDQTNRCEWQEQMFPLLDKRGLLTYQPLNPKTGQPWQARRSGKPEEFFFVMIGN